MTLHAMIHDTLNKIARNSANPIVHTTSEEGNRAHLQMHILEDAGRLSL
jgi:hypothetical protein